MRLAIEPDFRVIGEAADLANALSQIRTFCPDVVLFDLDMVHIDGIRMMAEMHTLCPNTLVVALSIHDDEQIRRLAAECGATSLVLKSRPAEMLLEEIRCVVA